MEYENGKRRPKRKWVAAIGAAVGALVTTFTESLVLGETVASLLIDLFG